MPVIDHPIHPSTQKGEDFRYGCWNREPFKAGYVAHPWSIAKYIPHNMSTSCKYDLSNKDPNCQGCKHRLSPVTFQVTNAE